MLFNKKKKEKENILAQASGIEIQKEEMTEKMPTKSDIYSKIDFKRLDKAKLINMLGEVIFENRTLTEQIEKLEEENREYIKSMMNYQKEVKTAEDKIFQIAQHICPELIVEMNNGTKFNLEGKVNTIIENVLEERKKAYELIKRTKEQVRDNKILLENLKKQLLTLIAEKNDTEIKPFNIEEFLDHSNNIKTETVKETDEFGNIKMSFKTIDLNEIKAKLNSKEKAVIEIIGTLGLSELPEIMRELENRNVPITQKVLDDTVKDLEQNDIVKIDKIKTMNRNAGVQILNLTTNIGKQLFKEIFGKPAIRSEKEILIRENASYEHGYSIKEVASILKDFGYLDVSYDRAKNTIDFSGANKWIPDIIAVNSVSKKKEYFEVEMGSQGEEVIEQKLSKANLKCRYLVIIVSNKLEREKMVRWVRNWYGKNPGSANTILTNIKTFKEFKEKDDGVTVGKGTNEEKSEVK